MSFERTVLRNQLRNAIYGKDKKANEYIAKINKDLKKRKNI